ncbi:copper chaperone PCu(A)C [Gemmatimonas sp.]|jgi:copper(I)-binding protein|uniref:copper chaperone PCu(A)C n=1 Tax=Gemmatimonas sp. TaxID=1962908 RepID=UPI0037C0C8F9
MTLRLLPVVTVAAVVLTGLGIACTTSDAPPIERIAVRSGWARIADSGATSGAYLEIANNDTVAITLVGVTTDDAGAAEVHETMQHDGMAHMMPRTEVGIPAGDVVTMAPGGVHVMLINLRRALVIGDSVRLRLRFSDSTSVNVTAPVRTP